MYGYAQSCFATNVLRIRYTHGIPIDKILSYNNSTTWPRNIDVTRKKRGRAWSRAALVMRKLDLSWAHFECNARSLALLAGWR